MAREPGALLVVTESCAGSMAILNHLPEKINPPPPPPPPPKSSHVIVYGPSYNVHVQSPKISSHF